MMPLEIRDPDGAFPNTAENVAELKNPIAAVSPSA